MMAGHPSGMQTVAALGRGLGAVPSPGGTDPSVALATVRSATLALEELAGAWPRFVSIDDFGLTTGVGYSSRLDYWRRHDKPQRNALCPCGSGRKFKNCIHDWGRPGPSAIVA
jgi:SEC-C motif